MIPDVKTILNRLFVGEISVDQARVWVERHIEMASYPEEWDLRDHFAGQAMTALVAFYGNNGKEDAARIAYEFADAMLSARKDTT